PSSPFCVRLHGRVPPDGVRPTKPSPSCLILNVAMSLLPASTAYSHCPSSLVMTAPCEPRPEPPPSPPVANVPAGASSPEADRENATTALPDAAFVSV